MAARLLHKSCVLAVFAGLVLAALVPADAATCYQFTSKDVYPNCIQLDANLVLHWRTLENQTLELAPDVDGWAAWVAIGISEGGLKGIDFTVAAAPNQGAAWIVGDYAAMDNGTLLYDQEQNVEMYTQPANDKDNHTMPVFQRPLDSCDAEDIPVYLDVERTLVWAYDWSADWDAAKLALSKYIRGALPGVRLYTSAAADSAAASNADNQTATFVSAMPAFVVPAAPVTSVMCVNLALPSDAQYSVVAYQGFNTTPLVGRMLGYVCAAGAAAPPQALGVPYECGSANAALPGLPAALPVGCETLNFMWVPGAGAFTAPPQAGFLIGAGAAKTMVLQVFYWNLGGAVGQVDSSGFRLSYTTQLRNASLGVLTVGNTDMRIPANNDSYTALQNICPSACTGKRVMAPVTLVSNFFLMRGLGKSVLTRHIRNGSAIMPVGRINYWDPNYVGFQTVFPDSSTLLPNDTLISVCTYNSSGVKSMTFYGTKNGSELCFNYITFYPVSAMPDLDYCIARSRDNVSSCGSRTRLTALAAQAANDTTWNGTRVPVGQLDIAFYKSTQCQLHDAVDALPKRKPNTRAAVASIVLVPIVLILIGAILYTKYSKQEELEALLARAREEGIDPLVTAD